MIHLKRKGTEYQDILLDFYEQLNAYQNLADPGTGYEAGTASAWTIAFISEIVGTKGLTSGIKGAVYARMAKDFSSLGLKKWSKVAFEEYTEMLGKKYINKKLMSKVVSDTLQKTYQGVTHGKVSRMGVRALNAMITSLPQSTYVGTTKIFDNAVRKLLPNNQEWFEPIAQQPLEIANAASEGSFSAALFKSWIENYKEVLSEQTGEFLFRPGLRYLARIDNAQSGFIGAISRRLGIKPDAVRRFVQHLSQKDTRSYWDRIMLTTLSKKFPQFSVKNILGTGRIGGSASLIGRIATGKLHPSLRQAGVGGFLEEMMEEVINREGFLTGGKDPLVRAYEEGGWEGTLDAFKEETKTIFAMLAPTMGALGGYSRYSAISQRGEGSVLRGIGNIISDVKTNDILHRIKNLSSEEFEKESEKLSEDINKIEKTDMKDVMNELIQKRKAWETNEGGIRGEAALQGYDTFTEYIGGIKKQNEIVDNIFRDAYAGHEESQETLINKIKSNKGINLNEVINPAIELAETYGKYQKITKKFSEKYGETSFRKKLQDDTKYAHDNNKEGTVSTKYRSKSI